MRYDPLRHDLLLVAADLEERRLIFAELREAGYEVLPAPGLLSAIQAVSLRWIAPRLILVDSRGDEDVTPPRMEELLGLAPGVPVILLIGAMDSEVWRPLQPRLAALLRRPLRIGEVVEAVNRKMPAMPP